MSERRLRLEALLERVRSNAAKPRVRATARSVPALATAAPISDTRLAQAPAELEHDEAEPVPLVRVATTPSEASRDETPDISITPFSETGEVSLLDVSEASIDGDLGDADFEDMSSELLESLPPAPAASWSSPPEGDTLVDEPPVSSQRPRLLEEPLAGEVTALGEDREVPLMTPPPESGPQEAPAPTGLFAPSAPDVEELLPSAPPGAAAAEPGPTIEQIGESVDLGEPTGGTELELDDVARPATIPPREELEALLDQQPMSGIYEEGLLPPPQAREELEAHDRLQAPASGLPEEAALEDLSASAQPDAYSAPAAEASGVTPVIHAATLPSAGTPSVRAPLPAFHPQSFLELLDASIALAG